MRLQASTCWKQKYMRLAQVLMPYGKPHGRLKLRFDSYTLFSSTQCAPNFLTVFQQHVSELAGVSNILQIRSCHRQGRPAREMHLA